MPYTVSTQWVVLSQCVWLSMDWTWPVCSVPQKLVCVYHLRRRVKSSSDSLGKGNGTLSSKFSRWRTTRPLHISSVNVSNWNVTHVCLVCNAASDLSVSFEPMLMRREGHQMIDSVQSWWLSFVDPVCHSPRPVNQPIRSLDECYLTILISLSL